jgi:sugar phosphate isomerase/epimerase
MKLGFFATGVLQNVALEEVAEFGASVGYQAIDVPAGVSGAVAVAAQHGLVVHSTLGIYGAPLQADEVKREKEVALLTRAIDIAANEGVTCVSAGHARDHTKDTRANLALFREAYAPLAKHAETRGVKIVFENWPNRGGNLMITPELWDRAFSEVPSAALGLCFDPSHLVWQGIDYIRALRDFGERVYHAHAKDTEFIPEGQYRYGIYGPQTEEPPWSPSGFWRYRLPGMGVIDWPKFIDTLYDIGYDGVVSVEHEDAVWGWLTDAQRAKRGLVLAQQVLAPLMV